MEGHWSSFVTEDDFKEIAGNGLNFVRIPVGYWSIAPLEGDPYIQGAWAWLQRGCDWAQSAGLKVMIDLHAAPGSQNGFDNSGEEGDVEWSEGNTAQQTFAAIRRLNEEFQNHPAVAAIELLNEPLGGEVDLGVLTQFYLDSWDLMRDEPLAIAFSDAFEGVEAWNDFGTSKDDLLLDVHHCKCSSLNSRTDMLVLMTDDFQTRCSTPSLSK